MMDQLKPRGRLVLPMGPAESQRMTLVERDAAGEANVRKLIPVRFAELETVR